MMMRFTLTLLFALCVAGCTSPAPAPVEADDEEAFVLAPIEAYRIGVGDVLRVDVWRSPELSVQVPVRPDGKVSMPLIGDVAVVGETPEDVAEDVTEELSAFVVDPQVSIIVTNTSSADYLTRVRVTGAVARQISVPFRRGMTVLDLILESGGPNDFARASATRLYRTGGKVLTVDLEAILERGDLATNYRIQPGDVITVPETIF
jgi:polysaccharide export outer membrane protein